MDAPQLVPGPTAGQWDARSRVLRMAGVLLFLVAVLVSIGAPSPSLLGVFLIVLLVCSVVSIVFGQLSQRIMRDEMRAGYSTLFDFAGYDLRDARTLTLVRSRDEAPAESGRVRGSILVNMMRPRPGTLLARRAVDDDR